MKKEIHFLTLMILSLQHLLVGFAFSQRRKNYEVTIFGKPNAFTENKSSECEYYTSDQLNDLD